MTQATVSSTVPMAITARGPNRSARRPVSGAAAYMPNVCVEMTMPIAGSVAP